MKFESPTDCHMTLGGGIATGSVKSTYRVCSTAKLQIRVMSAVTSYGAPNGSITSSLAGLLAELLRPGTPLQRTAFIYNFKQSVELSGAPVSPSSNGAVRHPHHHGSLPSPHTPTRTFTTLARSTVKAQLLARGEVVVALLLASAASVTHSRIRIVVTCALNPGQLPKIRAQA